MGPLRSCALAALCLLAPVAGSAVAGDVEVRGIRDPLGRTVGTATTRYDGRVVIRDRLGRTVGTVSPSRYRDRVTVRDGLGLPRVTVEPARRYR